MSSLAFVDLAVRYGRRDAVAGFTDTVRPGEWLCLIGPNGAGKSSILRATAGLVPHAIRLLAGASYRRLLPLSLVVGAAFLILADIPGRVLQDPAETPIGVVTAFFGAPVFILVLRTRGRSLG
jgi:energy-coupling factor transporter ATP-binding protein EcfA2